MSTPIVVAERWLASTLKADATLAGLVSAMRSGPASQGATYPLLVWELQPRRARNVSVVNGIVVMARLIYVVKVVGTGESYVAIDPAASRMQTLLHRQRSAVMGGEVISCVETEPLAYPELTTGGVSYRHLGGLYELLVKAT